jgi:hypothetical protein
LNRILLILLCCFTCCQSLAQPRLEVVLQKDYPRLDYTSPSIIAISHDSRWVVSYRNKDKQMIIWNLTASKIYASYSLEETLTTAEFLSNNEELLINQSLIFNIHSGKQKPVTRSQNTAADWELW